MAQKTLIYTSGVAGIRSAINELIDELQLASVAEAADVPGVPLEDTLDMELSKEDFIKFVQRNPDLKGLDTRVWNVLQTHFSLNFTEYPIYMGDLLRSDVMRSVSGEKSRDFLRRFMDSHHVEATDLPKDWRTPDLRPKPGTVRPDTWDTFDILITKADVDALKKVVCPVIVDQVPFDFIKKVVEALAKGNSGIPFGRRLMVGHVAHPNFPKIMKGLRMEGKQTRWTPVQTSAVFEAFARILGVTLDFTSPDWTPLDYGR